MDNSIIKEILETLKSNNSLSEQDLKGVEQEYLKLLNKSHILDILMDHLDMSLFKRLDAPILVSIVRSENSKEYDEIKDYLLDYKNLKFDKLTLKNTKSVVGYKPIENSRLYDLSMLTKLGIIEEYMIKYNISDLDKLETVLKRYNKLSRRDDKCVLE